MGEKGGVERKRTARIIPKHTKKVNPAWGVKTSLWNSPSNQTKHGRGLAVESRAECDISIRNNLKGCRVKKYLERRNNWLSHFILFLQRSTINNLIHLKSSSLRLCLLRLTKSPVSALCSDSYYGFQIMSKVEFSLTGPGSLYFHIMLRTFAFPPPHK